MTEDHATVSRARVLRVAAIRALEAAAHARRPHDDLMERAGEAVATMAVPMMAERAGPVLVLVGPGNNGGDALVAARMLHRRGIDVRVSLLDEAAAFRGQAATAWKSWLEAADDQAPVDPSTAIANAVLVVDGLFGIGYHAKPDSASSKRMRDWIDLVDVSGVPVLAIDLPSGVEGDTGHVADRAIRADRTIALIARTIGLHTGDGLAYCGDVVTNALGTDDDFSDDIHDALDRNVAFDGSAIGALNRPALFARGWKTRAVDSHKGSFGSVAVVGGNDGMVGGALLAARMALHSGVGRIYVRLLCRHGPGFDAAQPELMLRSSLDGVDANVFAIGPGLGQDDAAIAAVGRQLASDASLVLDADALNVIAKHASLAARLGERQARGLPLAVLTPHPLEAARLLACDVKTVQADRVAAATRLARATCSVVVLKGAGSVVADPFGVWVINPTGNPALATGGTGDVLCGLVAGLLAQRLSPLDAARMATWVHGKAADDLVAAGIGPVGVAASELIVPIRAVLNRLVTPSG